MERERRPLRRLLRPKGMKESHFFVYGRQVSLCGSISVEHDLIDPRLNRERSIPYCRECWRLFVRGEWRKPLEEEQALGFMP